MKRFWSRIYFQDEFFRVGEVFIFNLVVFSVITSVFFPRDVEAHLLCEETESLSRL